MVNNDDINHPNHANGNLVRNKALITLFQIELMPKGPKKDKALKELEDAIERATGVRLDLSDKK